jgi:hypothetical protein
VEDDFGWSPRLPGAWLQLGMEGSTVERTSAVLCVPRHGTTGLMRYSCRILLDWSFSPRAPAPYPLAIRTSPGHLGP